MLLKHARHFSWCYKVCLSQWSTTVKWKNEPCMDPRHISICICRSSCCWADWRLNFQKYIKNLTKIANISILLSVPFGTRYCNVLCTRSLGIQGNGDCSPEHANICFFVCHLVGQYSKDLMKDIHCYGQSRSGIGQHFHTLLLQTSGAMQLWDEAKTGPPKRTNNKAGTWCIVRLECSKLPHYHTNH